MEEDGSEDVEVITEKTPVCLVSDPTKTGVVMSVSGEGDLAQYSVFRKIANGVIIVDEGVV